MPLGGSRKGLSFKIFHDSPKLKNNITGNTWERRLSPGQRVERRATGNTGSRRLEFEAGWDSPSGLFSWVLRGGEKPIFKQNGERVGRDFNKQAKKGRG